MFTKIHVDYLAREIRHLVAQRYEFSKLEEPDVGRSSERSEFESGDDFGILCVRGIELNCWYLQYCVYFLGVAFADCSLEGEV
jgi:hypothetical protein